MRRRGGEDEAVEEERRVGVELEVPEAEQGALEKLLLDEYDAVVLFLTLAGEVDARAILHPASKMRTCSSDSAP